MGIDYYTCANCRATYPDCGPTWFCVNGHSIGPCCLDDSEEYEADNDGQISAKDCPCCKKGGTELERTKAELIIYREALIWINAYAQSSTWHHGAYVVAKCADALSAGQNINNKQGQ